MTIAIPVSWVEAAIRHADDPKVRERFFAQLARQLKAQQAYWAGYNVVRPSAEPDPEEEVIDPQEVAAFHERFKQRIAETFPTARLPDLTQSRRIYRAVKDDPQLLEDLVTIAERIQTKRSADYAFHVRAMIWNLDHASAEAIHHEADSYRRAPVSPERAEAQRQADNRRLAKTAPPPPDLHDPSRLERMRRQQQARLAARAKALVDGEEEDM